MDKTVVKCLRLVEALARSERPRGVTELATELGLTKSNVHRLLDTLMVEGYVKRHAERRSYELTLKLWDLAAAIVSHLDIREIARAHMRQLAAETGESVHLSVLEGDEVVYVDNIETSHPVRAYARLGSRAPAHCVATGKVMLAWRPEHAIAAVCERLEAATPATVTSAARLRREFARAREDGYAITSGEWRQGVGGVAAPIRNDLGEAFAAVAISGPTERLSAVKLRRMAPLVVATAARISRNLGYRDGRAVP